MRSLAVGKGTILWNPISRFGTMGKPDKFGSRLSLMPISMTFQYRNILPRGGDFSVGGRTCVEEDLGSIALRFRLGSAGDNAGAPHPPANGGLNRFLFGAAGAETDRGGARHLTTGWVSPLDRASFAERQTPFSPEASERSTPLSCLTDSTRVHEAFSVVLQSERSNEHTNRISKGAVHSHGVSLHRDDSKREWAPARPRAGLPCFEGIEPAGAGI